MDEKYHTWHKYFVYLPVYLTGGSSHDERHRFSFPYVIFETIS